MKKILSLLSAALFIFCMTSCSSSDGEETTDNQALNETAPVVSLLAEKQSVKAGDTVEVTINIKNSPYTACFDIFVVSDELFVYENSDVYSNGMVLETNYDDTPGGSFVINGFVVETVNLEDADICTVTYTVSEQAKAGDIINVMLSVPSFQVGIDESGNDVLDVEASLILNNLVFTVE